MHTLAASKGRATRKLVIPRRFWKKKKKKKKYRHTITSASSALKKQVNTRGKKKQRSPACRKRRRRFLRLRTHSDPLRHSKISSCVRNQFLDLSRTNQNGRRPAASSPTDPDWPGAFAKHAPALVWRLPSRCIPPFESAVSRPLESRSVERFCVPSLLFLPSLAGTVGGEGSSRIPTRQSRLAKQSQKTTMSIRVPTATLDPEA